MHYILWNNPTTGLLTSGDTVHEHIQVTPLTWDANPLNNVETDIDTVRGSCDPNEMSVTPAGCIPYTTDSTQLQYTINFENTGTDTAFNIYVMDTLSNYFDPKSLQIVMASAVMNIDIQKHDYYYVVRFDFPNINLLDRSHHNECNGAVIFTIKTMAGLPMGTQIFNHAGIFFDYNPVVMTNTAATTFGGCPAILPLISPIQSTNNSVEIYPNPTTDELTIKTGNGVYTSFTISNSIGQVMMHNPVSSAQTKVNVKTLPAGLYYITVRGEDGSKVMKFVKM